MAATTALDRPASATAHVGRLRALSVAGATLAAVAVWTIAVPLLGASLVVRFGDGAPQPVGLGLVAGASLVASLSGWGLLALLEARTSHPQRIWTRTALVVVLVSLSLPLTAGTTLSTRAALALMHVAVAVVLIPAMRRSAS